MYSCWGAAQKAMAVQSQRTYLPGRETCWPLVRGVIEKHGGGEGCCPAPSHGKAEVSNMESGVLSGPWDLSNGLTSFNVFGAVSGL